MKPLIAWLLIFSCLGLQGQNNPNSPIVKLSTGYCLEYPGLGGYSVNLEYDLPVINSFRVGVGTRFLQLNGYPRTNQVNEYTKGETIDFHFYWSPVESDVHSLTLGLSYSFCFYHVKRAFPVTGEDISKPMEWVSQESSGRTSGFSISGEYAYHFKESPFLVGLRTGIYKGYAYTYFVGPVIGCQF